MLISELKTSRLINCTLREHLPLVLIVVSYIITGYAVQACLATNRFMNVKFSYLLLTRSALFFSAIFLLIQFFRSRMSIYLNFRTIAGMLVVLMLCPPFMSTFSSIKQAIPIFHNFAWDQRLMRLDYILHFNAHPWQIFGFIYRYQIIIKVIDTLYMLWFPILFLISLWMAWSSRRQLRMHFFVTAALTWILLGTMSATIFSSAGPCYYGAVVDKSANPYAPLIAVLESIHEREFLFAVKNQLGLWKFYQSNTWLPFGGVSAMPSLHVAVAVLIAAVCWNVNVFMGVVMTVYAGMIQIGSFILGWHYAVDGYVSIVLTLLLWKGVKVLPFLILKEHVT